VGRLSHPEGPGGGGGGVTEGSELSLQQSCSQECQRVGLQARLHCLYIVGIHPQSLSVIPCADTPFPVLPALGVHARVLPCKIGIDTPFLPIPLPCLA